MKRTLLFISLLLMSIAGEVLAKDAPNRRTAPTQGGDATLIGGSAADPKEWPASVYASMSGASCSGTVVADRTMLFAAHCVSNNGTASFTVLGNRYTSKCTHHPSYKGNSTADWALCLVDRPVTGIEYENVNTDAALVKMGDALQLTGYGCIRKGGGGGNDGVFRIGTAPVIDLPQLSRSDYDIVTKGSAALCFGDSGGTVYKWLDAAHTQRVMVGVNSRGDISTTSYLPAYATPAFWDWAKGWETKNAQKLCVMGSGQKGCKYADGQEPPPPPPPGCKAELVAASAAQVKAGEAMKTLEQCLK